MIITAKIFISGTGGGWFVYVYDREEATLMVSPPLSETAAQEMFLRKIGKC